MKNQFGIRSRIIGRIESSKERLLSVGRNNVPFSLQRRTALKYPEIGKSVI